MFTIVSEKQCVEGVGEVHVYGIQTSGGVVVRDISVDKGKVDGLIQALNTSGVSEIHLLDIVADFLLC